MRLGEISASLKQSVLIGCHTSTQFDQPHCGFQSSQAVASLLRRVGGTVDVYIDGFNIMAKLCVCNLRPATALVPGSFKATIATRLKGYE
jgi:hypothetical protein